MKRKLLLATAVVLGVQTIAPPAFAPLEAREMTIKVTVNDQGSPSPATISGTRGGKETVVASGLVLTGGVDCAGSEACSTAGLEGADVVADTALQVTRRDGSASLQGRMTALITVEGIESAVGLRARVRGSSACGSNTCEIDLRVKGTLFSPGTRRVGTAQFELSGGLAWSTQGVAWESLGGSGTLSYATTWDPTNGGPWG